MHREKRKKSCYCATRRWRCLFNQRSNEILRSVGMETDERGFSSIYLKIYTEKKKEELSQ